MTELVELDRKMQALVREILDELQLEHCGEDHLPLRSGGCPSRVLKCLTLPNRRRISVLGMHGEEARELSRAPRRCKRGDDLSWFPGWPEDHDNDLTRMTHHDLKRFSEEALAEHDARPA